MSEGPDRESQTEEATEKKLTDALARGVVPVSTEVSLVASLSGMLVAAIFVLPTSVERLTALLVHFIDDPSGWQINSGGDAKALGELIAANVAVACAPLFVVMLAFGLVASFAQNPPRLVLDRITPKWSRISIREGAARLLGVTGWTNFLKNFLKFVAVTGIAAAVLDANRVPIIESAAYDVQDLPERIGELSAKLLASLIVAAVVVAAADLVWARIHWRQGQRMSRQEIKDELKQLEGDPLLKARFKSIRTDRARKRMLTAVPKATMVIANPTHFAVALRYVRSEGGVPIVVAKGQDLIALRIREIAEANEIPVIEDKPLARSLYAAVKVDRAIPPEFYRAIAEVIHLVYRRKNRGTIVRESRAS